MPRPSANNPLGLPTVSEPVVVDRPCRRCSYNLKGLKTGDRCPECGTPINSARRYVTGDSITECPLAFIHALHRGAIILLWSALIAGIGAVWFVVQNASSPNLHSAAAIACLGAAGWACGVYFLHSPRPGALARAKLNSSGDHPKPADSLWRLVNRLSQALWLLAILFFWTSTTMYATVAAALNSNSPAILSDSVAKFFFVAGWFCVALAVIGFFSLCYYMALLCDWAADHDLAHRFRTAPLLTLLGGGVCGYLLLQIGGYIATPTRLGPMSSISMVILVILLLFFCKGSVFIWISFANLMSWALKNRDTASEIDRRVSEKIIARIEDNKKDSAKAKGARGVRV